MLKHLLSGDVLSPNERRLEIIRELKVENQPRLLQFRLACFYGAAAAHRGDPVYTLLFRQYQHTARTNLLEAMWPDITQNMDRAFYSVCKHKWTELLKKVIRGCFIDARGKLPSEQVVSVIHCSVLYLCSEIYSEHIRQSYPDEASSQEEESGVLKVGGRRVSRKKV